MLSLLLLIVSLQGYSTPAADQRFGTVHAGILRGDKSLVRLELAKEGDFNINGMDPKSNTTLLSAAVTGGFTEIVRMLLVAGADVNGWVHEDGNSMLHLAIKNGNEPIALLLIQYGYVQVIRSLRYISSFYLPLFLYLTIRVVLN